MTRLIMAEIRCDCGKWVNIRLKETYRGEANAVSCWNCSRVIKLQNGIGYCNGKRVRTTIVLDEVIKNGD